MEMVTQGSFARPLRRSPRRRGSDGLVDQASFLFEGIEIPESLKQFAREIEFGRYDPAIPSIAAIARNGRLKQFRPAAQAMFEKLKPLAETFLKRAKRLGEEGRKFAAYREYGKISAWSKTTDFEKTAAKEIETLKLDRGVRKELAAQTVFEQAVIMLATDRRRSAQLALTLLRRIQKDYPGTETAKKAQALERSISE